jgi:KaiC/GvpD/RAD55 family RecA-like ATPase
MQTKPTLKTPTLGELLDRYMPPRDYLLEPLMKENESLMIWAAPGVGKTLLSLSLAIAVAGGGSILGWKASKPWKVLFLDGEMPIDDLRDRLKMLMASVDDLDTEAALDNLTILSRHDQEPEVSFPDLGDEKNQASFLSWLRWAKFDLVICDNLSTLAYLEDENSAAAITPVVKFLQKIKQSRIGCIVVHHSNKAGSDYRGSSNIATTFEVILGLLEIDTILDENQGAAFKLEFTKFRGKWQDTLGSREVRLTEDFGKAQWDVKVSVDDLLKAIVAVIRSGKCSKQADILDHLPNRFWPNSDKTPSKGWLSERVKQIRAQGMMRDFEIKEAFSGTPENIEEPLNLISPDY